MGLRDKFTQIQLPTSLLGKNNNSVLKKMVLVKVTIHLNKNEIRFIPLTLPKS